MSILKISITIIILSIFFSCNNLSEKNKKKDTATKISVIENNNPPKIKFDTLMHDFGTLTEGEIIEYNFFFKNIGGKNLKITEVIPDCGCTITEYDKKNIKSGEEGKVKIIFDSSGFRNNQYKTIKVKTNTGKEIELIVTAFVEVN